MEAVVACLLLHLPGIGQTRSSCQPLTIPCARSLQWSSITSLLGDSASYKRKRVVWVGNSSCQLAAVLSSMQFARFRCFFLGPLSRLCHGFSWVCLPPHSIFHYLLLVIICWFGYRIPEFWCTFVHLCLSFVTWYYNALHYTIQIHSYLPSIIQC